jgi:cytochrome d ubiquinol oxidase subunit II
LGVGQYPWILDGELTINDAAGASATPTGLLVVVAMAVGMEPDLMRCV